MRKYMCAFSQIVEKKITNMLPKKWLDKRSHPLSAMFGIWVNANVDMIEEKLLSISPLMLAVNGVNDKDTEPMSDMDRTGLSKQHARWVESCE
jgi:hypothetical protein